MSDERFFLGVPLLSITYRPFLETTLGAFERLETIRENPSHGSEKIEWLCDVPVLGMVESSCG